MRSGAVTSTRLRLRLRLLEVPCGALASGRRGAGRVRRSLDQSRSGLGAAARAGPLAGAQAVTLCDAILHAQKVYRRAPSLAIDHVRTAVAALGTTYTPAVTLTNR